MDKLQLLIIKIQGNLNISGELMAIMLQPCWSAYLYVCENMILEFINMVFEILPKLNIFIWKNFVSQNRICMYEQFKNFDKYFIILF